VIQRAFLRFDGDGICNAGLILVVKLAIELNRRPASGAQSV